MILLHFQKISEIDFLTNVTNKTILNKYLAQKLIQLHDNDKQTLCIAYNAIVISNDNNVLNESLITSKEADSRIILHAINLAVNDYKEFSIETVDSDVVVISFGCSNIVKDAGIEKFSVVCGPKEKHFDVSDNLSYFWEEICRA